MTSHRKRPCLRIVTNGQATKDQQSSEITKFDQHIWEACLLRFLINAKLPVDIINLPHFHSLFHLPTQDGPIVPTVSHLRNKLESLIKDRQTVILERLAENSKLSISIACWTSSSGQVFVIVNAYFFDKEWTYQEVLLGFEPLCYIEGGTNLDSIIDDILHEHEITTRVYCITTDYVIDHQSMSDVPAESFGPHTTLITVPCISKVMNWTLSTIFTQVQLDPVPDARQGGVPRDQGISQAIEKIKSLTRYIHGPHDEEDSPCDELQNLIPALAESSRLTAINLLLTRACIYQSKIRQVFRGIAKEALLPNSEEWRQIEYLIWITRPFFEFLNDLAITTDATTHLVLLMYRSLLQHMDRLIARLECKTTPWKRGLLRALQVPLYAAATMLAPAKKLNFFQTDEWNADAPDTFRRCLKSLVIPYQTSLSSVDLPSSLLSRLDRALNHETRDEVAEYLSNGTVDEPPSVFWRKNQAYFPALSALARNVLSIPATGSGLERISSIAHDMDLASPGLPLRDFRGNVMIRCTPKMGPGDCLGEERNYVYLGRRDEEISLLDSIDIAEISDTEEHCAKGKKRRGKSRPEIPPKLRRSTRLCVEI